MTSSAMLKRLKRFEQNWSNELEYRSPSLQSFVVVMGYNRVILKIYSICVHGVYILGTIISIPNQQTIAVLQIWIFRLVIDEFGLGGNAS